MNWIQFGRLIHSIYSHNGKLPDLDWIQSLGLLAVKLGQVHALRSDFLEPEKCEHLSKLFRNNYAMGAEDFLHLIESTAVQNFTSHFEEIEPEALASASVGQVHLGILKDGTRVVIKAVKKDVRKDFIADVSSVRRLFGFISFFYRKLKRVGNPEAILNDIEEYTLSELDLRKEVDGVRALALIRDKNKDQYDFSKLSFAKVHGSLCNENVMVSDFIPGPSLDELLDEGKLDYDTLLELFKIHGYYMFCAGTFHGDLHPGNVLVDEDQGHFYFIDTGYIGRVGPKIRKGLFYFFKALTENDFTEAANSLSEMAEVPLTGDDMKKFQSDLINLYENFPGKSVSEISLTRQMMETIKLGVQAGMSFDQGIFAIVRSLMYLDGMVLRCNPDAVLMEDMKAFIDDFEKFM
ncbi:MAG TPA: hypothetical protein DCE22_06640 [Verrucomicrobiales bacterium]|nr:hypothetical protein [Verrucomicrobiales bacterium]